MTREEAIEEIRKTIDWAKALNSAVPGLINITGAEEALEVLEQRAEDHKVERSRQNVDSSNENLI